MPHNQHLITKSVLFVLPPQPSMASCVGVQASHSAINHAQALHSMCAPQHTHTHIQDCASCSSSPRTACVLCVVVLRDDGTHVVKHPPPSQTRMSHSLHTTALHTTNHNTPRVGVVLNHRDGTMLPRSHHTNAHAPSHQPDILPSTPRSTARSNPPSVLSPHRFAPSGAFITTTQCAHKHSTQKHTRKQASCSSADVSLDATTQPQTSGYEWPTPPHEAVCTSASNTDHVSASTLGAHCHRLSSTQHCITARHKHSCRGVHGNKHEQH